MANSVKARLEGDEYQHLASWFYILELKRPRSGVNEVTIEDEDAGSADDITVRHSPGSARPNRFYQIKYHVDQRAGYSTESLLASKENGTSILKKLFATWKLLKEGGVPIELHFVSNHSWDLSDKTGEAFSGRTNGVKSIFFDADPRSDLGKIRQLWVSHLGASPEEFEAFCKCLYFDLGATCLNQTLERAAERMEHLSLRHDQAGIKTAVGIVREWIETGVQRIDVATLDKAIQAHNLKQEEEERAATVVMTTIKQQRLDFQPDYVLDWREHFEGPEYEKGHKLKPGESWEQDLLPQLRAVEAAVAEETGCRLVRARGLARLSAWFALGRTFSENARYVIECDQQEELWRSDAPPSSDFQLIRTGSSDKRELSELIVGISVTTNVEPAVTEYASKSGFDGNLLFLTPNLPLGRNCLRNAGDAVALARQVKDVIREEIGLNSISCVSLFYAGPLSGACFIGHVLNSMGAPVQVMEYQDPVYAPAFTI